MLLAGDMTHYVVTRAGCADGERDVLVVDDNVDAATSLGTLLECRGHSVHTCFDGSTAFETATRSPPEVAFIDLNMPSPGGAELARMIRKQVWGNSVKLIALTGMGQPADLERTRAAGFDEHLTKPADPDALFTAVSAGLVIRNGRD